ncbi:MAG: S41 family peptidase [Nitrospinae bacterium]|nr:S41 family peptidase [Nitrospinota bacterium]
MKNRIKTIIAVTGVLLLISTAIALYSGQQQVMALGEGRGGYEHISTFAEVLSILTTSYVKEVDTKELIEGAINGMLETLDPHSAYLTPENFKELQIDTKGEFGGLGIEITIKDKLLTIVSPIEDTPAHQAGIKAGDIIIKIDEELTRDMSLTDAVNKMRGKPGTSITLTIIRKDASQPIAINITRDIIKIKSVTYEIIGGDIGYVKLKKFINHSDRDLVGALNKFKEAKVSGIILDLRNNPGGLLTQAVSVTNQFVKKGQLIVYTKGRAKEQDQRYIAEHDGLFTEGPMIVLVNAGSASASEIVAGALQDTKRAIVLGETSFGKGSVQTVIPLSDSSGLKLTTALYYTPNDRVIQGEGIIPDIVVVEEKTEIAAKEENKTPNHLREKDLNNYIKKDKKGTVKEKEKGYSADGDIVKERAVALLKSWKIFKTNKN